METQENKLAVVVLNWNGKNWLEKFLPILVQNSNKSKIIIIDNNSTDNSVDFISNNFPFVRIIHNKINSGYASGYNYGLSQINTEYYILINTDVEVTKDWIKPILDLMEKNPKVAACQPKLLNFNNKNQFEYAGASGGFIDFLGYPLCRGRIFDYFENDNGQYDNSTEIFWATGACLFIRASHFWEVGGFDDDFFAHQEEIDLCWRLKNIGYSIMVQPKSVVYHVGGGTLNTTSPLKTFLNFRNNLYMLFKNLTFVNLFLVFPLRLLLDGIAAISFLRQENGIKHFFSVIKAHFIFYCSIPKLIKKRNLILQAKQLKGILNFSLVVKNKLFGIKKFSEL